MRRSKRALSKGKIFGFNPWVDQLRAVNQIAEETGQKSQAAIIRELLDDGLAARRQKIFSAAETPARVPQEDETLQTIQMLLLQMIRQGERALRIQGLSLELLQEVLAEARAGRKISWKHLAVPALDEKMTPSGNRQKLC